MQVLYPVVEISSKSTNSPHAQRPHYAPSAVYGEVFVSLNRYERKKKIETALDAMALLVANRKRTKKNETEGKEQNDNDDMKRVLLVIAGGYDPRVAENREYLEVMNVSFVFKLELKRMSSIFVLCYYGYDTPYRSCKQSVASCS